MEGLSAVVLVFIATLVAVYELNCIVIVLCEIEYSRSRRLLLHSLHSSSRLRRPRRFHARRRERRYWIRPGRTQVWWDNFLLGIVLPEEWKENFRMSRDSFFSLCDQLRPFIERQRTTMRDPVNVEKQVALSLYYLADEGRMRKTANAFGLSRSSVSIVVTEDSRLASEAVLLGSTYNISKDKGIFRKHVQSRLWFTYRKGFKAVGGTNLTSDQGWGCTLRCGQMLLAEALMRKHLPAEWCWHGDSKHARYMTILSKFLDLKESPYSIHKIAAQGTDFGRKIGEWFGPNTIAHVLRKLTDLDSWSQIGVVMATDMAVIVKELDQCCMHPFVYHTGKVCVEHEEENPEITTKSLPSKIHSSGTTSSHNEGDILSDYQVMSMSILEDQKTKRSGDSAGSFDLEGQTSPTNMFQSYANIGSSILDVKSSTGTGTDSSEGPSPQSSFEGPSKQCGVLRSVLILIPLRLGNEKFNPLYWEGLKRCLDMPQTVGIIGGRPRHALWFVGYRGDYLLYLDPHTTHPVVKTGDTRDIPDGTYHCSKTDMMHYQELDPSLALGFFCRDADDVRDFHDRVKKTILPLKPPLFEILPERPSYWKETKDVKFTKVEPFLLVNAECSTEDEEFVLIELPEKVSNKPNTS